MQEALFDAEGNMLPREDTAQKQALPASSTPAAQASAAAPSTISDSKAASERQGIVATKAAPPVVNDRALSGPAKQQPKQGVLQLACFCFRPRTRSADDPYPQGSLRDRFAAKPASTAAKSDQAAMLVNDQATNIVGSKRASTDSSEIKDAVSGKVADAKSSKSVALVSNKAEVPGGLILKAKGPSQGLESDKTAPNDWDLKAEQQQTEAAVAASMQETEGGSDTLQFSSEPLLQGAVSLAPKTGLAAARSTSDDRSSREADDSVHSKEGQHCMTTPSCCHSAQRKSCARCIWWCAQQNPVHVASGGAHSLSSTQQQEECDVHVTAHMRGIPRMSAGEMQAGIRDMLA